MRAALLVPLLAGLLAWLPSLARSGWSVDDLELVRGNPVIEGDAPLAAAFERDYFAHRGGTGWWRPIASLSLRLDHALWGERAAGYHWTNVLLHALCCLVATLLAAELLAEKARAPLPILGLSIFAAHPVLADSVAWISGRTSMLGALPVLAAALATARAARRGAGPLPLGALAALGLWFAAAGKEEGLALAPLLWLAAQRGGRRAAAAALAGTLVATLCWLLARRLALGEALPQAAGADLFGRGLAERLAWGGAAVVEGLRLLALPLPHPPEYTPRLLASRLAPLPLPAAAVLGWLAMLCALLGAAAALGGRSAPLTARGWRPAALAAGLAALAWLPTLQILPAGEVFAPRFLYLPLLLAAPAVDAVLRRLAPPRGARLLAGALVLALAGTSIARAGVYASRASHRLALLAHDPESAPAWNDLGLAREEAGDLAGARAAWRRAIELDPHYSKPLSNLGRIALGRREIERATALLEEAVRRGPRNPIAHLNLAGAYLAGERLEDARRLYERTLALAPDLGPAWRGLAAARRALGDLAGARAALERALALDPGDAAARRALAHLLR